MLLMRLVTLHVCNLSHSGTIYVVGGIIISSERSSVGEARCFVLFMFVMERVCSHVYVLSYKHKTCRAESPKSF